jgi:zinc transport system substrate-binding protein
MLAVLAIMAGCGGKAPGDGRVRVVASFYPLQYVAQQVGGDRVNVTNLVQPGAEPHDLELSPQQMAAIADADLVLYLPGFQPSVDDAVSQDAHDTSLDVAAGITRLESPEGGKDPHVWLDPAQLITITNAVADRLATIDPANATAYHQRAATLDAALSTLDGELAAGLASCQRRQIVTSHAAFGYLAQRYGLTQIPITGLSPEVEPTPQHLAEAAETARQAGATTIFFETLVSPKVAQAVAATIGAGTAVLDPIEGLAPDAQGDYVTVMRENLATLRTALGCR